MTAPMPPNDNISEHAEITASRSRRPGRIITVTLGWVIVLVGFIVFWTALSIEWVGEYGWFIFFGLPSVLGFGCGLIAAGDDRASVRRAIGTVLFGDAVAAVAFLAFGIEGMICVMMAAPLWLPVSIVAGLLGFGVGRALINSFPRRALLWFTLGLTPLMLGAEAGLDTEPPLIEVSTAVDIDAPPDVVWQQVIAFSTLPEPDRWLFRAGVAYPIRAAIEGQGVGAIRHCVFSTGLFVEPITAWQPGKLLAFDVIENPPTMRELSPWGHLHTPHTHGYFESKRGQFALIDLGGGRTRLVGTTWYTHDIRPAAYWQLWSDHIVHRIHERVLANIKRRAEAQP